MQERGYSAHNAYSLSKLAEQLFTFELAERLRAAGSPVTCNCLDPGGACCSTCCCWWWTAFVGGCCCLAATVACRLAACCCCCLLQLRLPAAAQRVTAETACPCLPAPGTVNTKMLKAGWGSIGIAIKAGVPCAAVCPEARVSRSLRPHSSACRPLACAGSSLPPLLCAQFQRLPTSPHRCHYNRMPTTSSRRPPTLRWPARAAHTLLAGGRPAPPASR